MGSKWANRQVKGRTDANQQLIIDILAELSGVSVEPKHDDIFVGYQMLNFWFEIKNEDAVSKRSGMINQSAKKKSQIKLEETWEGQYNIVTSIDEILEIIGYTGKR